MKKTNEQLYTERAKRINDAINLRKPDRIPVVLPLGFFPAKYGGITCQDAFYNPAKWRAAAKKTVFELKPDAFTMTGAQSGAALEALDFKQMLWPGHGVSPNHTFQFVEGEYMKAEEYDAFLEDPSDFILRTYLPRVNGTLQTFNKLPHTTVLLFGPTSILGLQELDGAITALSKARQEIIKYNAEWDLAEKEITVLFPLFTKASTFTPFDIISDRLRGMRGSMLDMYRNGEKLLQTCERLLPIILRSAIARSKATGNPRVFIPLHRGAEGFMSVKQFDTFYWPTLKGLITGLVDAGLTPCPFFEGDYTSRLQYLAELPAGKIVGHFDTSNIIKVKEVIGRTMCIMGNIPSSLLQVGSEQDVRDYCKKIIDDIAYDGGFIVTPRSAIDEAKPENVRAMIEFTQEYGVYK